MIDLCFRTFRRQRAHFRHLLVDVSGCEVADDSTLPCCGRSLQEIVRMVVRTAARRHFRRRRIAVSPSGNAAVPACWAIKHARLRSSSSISAQRRRTLELPESFIRPPMRWTMALGVPSGRAVPTAAGS